MTLQTPPKLILASQSPRRKELLSSLGVDFTVQSADIDETEKRGEHPLKYVKRIARAKAEKIFSENPDCTVLAADTPVYVGRRINQNPETPEEERAMLESQSGRKVVIPTAVVLMTPDGKRRECLVTTWVKFKKFTPSEIEHFVQNPELWQGVSGGMKIGTSDTQKLIVDMHGTISAIQGMPLYDVRNLLISAGYNA